MRFDFVAEDGVKVFIDGLGPLARCSVEEAGANGTFKSFDVKTKRYETGAGRAGTVLDEGVKKLEEFLTNDHSNFEQGEDVVLKGGSATILELSDGYFKFCYNDHRGISNCRLKASCFVRSTFTFIDSDDDVVTIFGRSNGARCTVTRKAESMALESLDISTSQYCVAGKRGKFRAQQLANIITHLEGGVSNLLKGERVELRDKLGVISDLRERRGLVKVMFTDGNESEFVAAAQVTRKGLDIKVKSPSAYKHGRHILEQDFVKGTSLESLMALADKFEKQDFGAADDFTKAGFNIWNIQNEFPSAIGNAYDAYTHGFVPCLGSMLMHDGLGHADPHAGNLLFDHAEKTLWVIDWGAIVELNHEQRTGVRDLCHQVCMAEIEQPTSETSLANAELSFTTAQKPVGLGFWRFVFHPGEGHDGHPPEFGYEAPEGVDLEALKKSLESSEVVLCLETMMLTSRLIASANEKTKERQKKSPTPPLSLLSLWDGITTLRQPEAASSCEVPRSVSLESTN
jgi:hypothetical protein